MLLIASVLLVSVHRLPAPISEVETPTPAPEQRVKPKPKRTPNPKVTSEDSTREQTGSPSPKSQRVLNPFDGTWVGTINIGYHGDVDYTITISGGGTIVRETTRFGTFIRNPMSDGRTLRWNWKITNSGVSTLTPNPDGKTALFTDKTVSTPVMGIGAHDSSAIFRKVSP